VIDDAEPPFSPRDGGSPLSRGVGLSSHSVSGAFRHNAVCSSVTTLSKQKSSMVVLGWGLVQDKGSTILGVAFCADHFATERNIGRCTMIDLPLAFLVGLALVALLVTVTTLLLLNSIRKDAMRVRPSPLSVLDGEGTQVSAGLTLIAPSSLIERIFHTNQSGV